MRYFMKTMRQQILVLILPIIFLLVFFNTSTNTILTFLLGLTYFAILLLISFLLLLIDLMRKTNYRILPSKILLTSLAALILGIFAIKFQKQLNKGNAEKLISEIEYYKKENGKYPNKYQVKIPKSINGIKITDMEYILNSKVYKNDYVIKYFDGYMYEKLYFSNSKKWHVDD